VAVTRPGPSPFALAIVLGTSVPLGCNLLLSDWEVEPGPSPADTSSAGAAPSTGGAGGAGGAAGHGGAAPGGSGPTPAIPLQATALEPAGVAVWRDGHFRIEADPDSMWQWARWFYLPADADAASPLGPVLYRDETPVYRTSCLWTGVRSHGADDPMGFSMRSCSLTPTDTNATFFDGGGTWPELDADMLPAWYTLAGEVHDGWGGETTFHTRVFASGRVWTWTHLRSTYSGGPVDNADLIFGLIGLRADEFHVPPADAPGLFTMKSGGGALLAVDTGRLSPEEPGPTPGATWEGGAIGLESDGVSGRWELTMDLVENEVVTFPFAFFLGPNAKLAAEREARALDLRSPGLLPVAGATTIHVATGGLDPETGTYQLDREQGATEVVFSLDAATLEMAEPIARFEPAFEIANWTSASWVIRLGTSVLGSSDAQDSQLLARHTAGRLAFQYLGIIAADATEEDRTFTVSER
jgi:hypothetical protein